MHRVFFDTNAGGHDVGYILWFDQSRDDISRISPEERDGASVILTMPEELEIPARLKFDHELNCWRGVPIEK